MSAEKTTLKCLLYCGLHKATVQNKWAFECMNRKDTQELANSMSACEEQKNF